MTAFIKATHLFKTNLPAYVVILRAIHSRGDDQADALTELARRGLRLSPEQKTAAGLPADYKFTMKGS